MTSGNYTEKQLLQACNTEKQRNIVKAYFQYGQKKAAKILGYNSSGTIGNVIHKLRARIKRLELEAGIAEGFNVDKVSTLTRTDENGNKEVVLE